MEQSKLKENILSCFSGTIQGTPVYTRSRMLVVLHKGANHCVGLPWGVHEEPPLLLVVKVFIRVHSKR